MVGWLVAARASLACQLVHGLSEPCTTFHVSLTSSSQDQRLAQPTPLASLAGTLPTWDTMPSTQVFIKPGNSYLCGPVSQYSPPHSTPCTHAAPHPRLTPSLTSRRACKWPYTEGEPGGWALAFSSDLLAGSVTHSSSAHHTSALPAAGALNPPVPGRHGHPCHPPCLQGEASPHTGTQTLPSTIPSAVP